MTCPCPIADADCGLGQRQGDEIALRVTAADAMRLRRKARQQADRARVAAVLVAA